MTRRAEQRRVECTKSCKIRCLENHRSGATNFAFFLLVLIAFLGLSCEQRNTTPAVKQASTPISTPTKTPAVSIPAEGSCPAGMALVPGGRVKVLYRGEQWGGSRVKEVDLEPFCVDIYEASQPDATARSMGSWRPFDPVPPAASKPGVLPWTTLTWDKAAAACQAAGKRLLSLAEWQVAYSGTTGLLWPWGGAFQTNSCNAGGRREVQPTGVCCFSVCEGACYRICDMVGNVAEWVADYWNEECYGTEKTMVAGGSYNIDYVFPDTKLPYHNIQRPDPEHPGCWIMSSYSLDRSGVHGHSREAAVPDDGFRCARSIRFKNQR